MSKTNPEIIPAPGDGAYSVRFALTSGAVVTFDFVDGVPVRSAGMDRIRLRYPELYRQAAASVRA